MEWNKTEWVGAWENFENYIYSENQSMTETWKEAEAASRKHPGLAKMFANGCKAFWQTACNTVTDKNPVRIGAWEVKETVSGLEIEWFDTEENSLGKAEYIADGILEKGLEGKANLRLFAENAPKEWAFRCLLLMSPMPKREEKLSGGLLSHFHFQFGAAWNELIENEKLKKTMWYATMCDRDAEEVQKCNIVRALHKLPVI